MVTATRQRHCHVIMSQDKIACYTPVVEVLTLYAYDHVARALYALDWYCCLFQWNFHSLLIWYKSMTLHNLYKFSGCSAKNVYCSRQILSSLVHWTEVSIRWFVVFILATLMHVVQLTIIRLITIHVYVMYFMIVILYTTLCLYY